MVQHVSKFCLSGSFRQYGKKHKTLLHYEPLEEKKVRYHSDRKQVLNESSNRATGNQWSSHSQVFISLWGPVNDGHNIVESNLAV